MSAALGGVDSMTVTPFDKTYETPDEFSERLARNQQLLLKGNLASFLKCFASSLSYSPEYNSFLVLLILD